ncbi:MAG: VOC family protein [Rhizobiales bacterium]|nr:VOC family protein [Hyphomicrobiales bacterium]
MPDYLVNIDVDDLEKAIAFYQAAFGLTLGRHFGADAVELNGGPAPIYLLAKPAASPAFTAAAGQPPAQARAYSRHWTPVHLDFVVADIQAALERAIAAGALPEGPVKTSKWGHLALLSDPFGHGFCLIEFLGGGYDEIADASAN